MHAERKGGRIRFRHANQHGWSMLEPPPGHEAVLVDVSGKQGEGYGDEGAKSAKSKSSTATSRT